MKFKRFLLLFLTAAMLLALKLLRLHSDQIDYAPAEEKPYTNEVVLHIR